MADEDVEKSKEKVPAFGAAESLFSFEFVVQSVTDVSVECLAPAVGFRLLDYPTVMIYHTHPEKIENLRKLSEISVGSIDSAAAGNKTLFPNLREKDGSFTFRKGKSTLFSMEFGKVCDLLMNVPVYIVLLDVFAAKPRMVGSCTVSLQSAIEEIKQSIRAGTNNAPTLSSKVFAFKMYNLMGTVIGCVTGKYTLYSYGSSLSKHVLKSNSSRPIEIFLDNKWQGDNIPNVKPHITPQKLKSNELLKEIKTRENSTDTNELQTHYSDLQKRKKESHKEAKLKYIHKTKPKEIKLPDHDLEKGIFYPPPMVYCSEFSDELHDIERTEDIKLSKNVSNPNYPMQNKAIPHWLKETYSTSEDLKVKALASQVPYEPTEAKVGYVESSSIKKESNTSFVTYKKGNPEGEIAVLLESLEDMPLLQGLLKEIVKLSKNSEKKLLENSIKHKNDAKVVDAGDRNANESKEQDFKGNAVSGSKSKKKYQNKGSKKLKFRMTKSHHLRCAMNVNKNSELVPTKDEHVQSKSRNAQNTSKRAKKGNKDGEKHFHTKDFKGKRNEEMEIKSLQEMNLEQTKETGDTAGHIDHLSLKSKSPVSLEIHLPSTFGSEDINQSSNGDGNSSVAGSPVQSGIYSLPKLEKRWMGLDDLSQMKKSVDDIGNELAKSESGNSFKSLPSRIGSYKERDSQKSARKSPSLYSDAFHSAEESPHSKDDDASRNYSRNHKASDSSASRTHRSIKSASSPGSGSSSNSMTSSRKPRSPNENSARQSNSIDLSKSNKSINKRNTSDLSKPVISAHSPTTSRSLRTKHRQSYDPNDEITQSVDISDVSLRTDDTGRQSPFTTKDSQADGMSRKSHSSFIENKDAEERYSDDFLTNSGSSGSLKSVDDEDYRTATPNHIILSQTKLGYTM
ncbi:uncharacterized protein LOC135689390 [Rhopilema esculentum]|uniref:uncharacterized protein LOC135689390 n=1 Tax=Rhopilema esculentum TaxID=499914 RepID=UPI0031D65956|eukprot:gene3250-1576_t